MVVECASNWIQTAVFFCSFFRSALVEKDLQRNWKKKAGDIKVRLYFRDVFLRAEPRTRIEMCLVIMTVRFRAEYLLWLSGQPEWKHWNETNLFIKENVTALPGRKFLTSSWGDQFIYFFIRKFLSSQHRNNRNRSNPTKWIKLIETKARFGQTSFHQKQFNFRFLFHFSLEISSHRQVGHLHNFFLFLAFM